MNKQLILVLMVVVLAGSSMGLVYSVGTHLAQSTGSITVTAPPESGEITVAATIAFGSVEQGQSSAPIQVHVGNTVGRTLTLSVSGGIQGAITIQLCTSSGDPLQTTPIPIGGADIYLKATTTTQTPIAPGQFPVTLTAS